MRVGIIGLGAMGSAIASGLIKKEMEVILFNRNKDKLDRFRDNKNVECASSMKELAKNSDCIILAVKPYVYQLVADEIYEEIGEKIIISIAPSFTIESFNKIFPDKKFVLAMPNTPAMVLAGLTGICPNDKIDDTELKDIVEIFNALGETAIINEKEFPAFLAATSSMPAFIAMFIEAASDAAVYEGMKRQDSYNFIAEAMIGTAKLIKEKMHPAELKDMVSSPGGTTIEGVRSLEQGGFRSAVMQAIISTAEKSKNM